MYTDFPSIIAGDYPAQLVHIAPNYSHHHRRITFHFRLDGEECPAFLTVNSSLGKKSKLRKIVDTLSPSPVDKEKVFESKKSLDRFLHSLIGQSYHCTVLLGDQGYLKVDQLIHQSIANEVHQ